jgi:N-acetylglutamate synthase-like GNAT family acetyltransferase
LRHGAYAYHSRRRPGNAPVGICWPGEGAGAIVGAVKRRTRETLTVRSAGFADAEPIYKLIKEHPRELLARAVTDIVQNIDRFLVCEVRGRVAGTVSWSILPEIGLALHPTVELKSLAVSKHFQRRGLGSALVAAAIERVRALKPAQIIVLTFTPAFFHGLGFREVPKASLMHKLYMGCINCAKYDSPFTCPEVAMALPG